jgi:hypothetical protein
MESIPSRPWIQHNANSLQPATKSDLVHPGFLLVVGYAALVAELLRVSFPGRLDLPRHLVFVQDCEPSQATRG